MLSKCLDASHRGLSDDQGFLDLLRLQSVLHPDVGDHAEGAPADLHPDLTVHAEHRAGGKHDRSSHALGDAESCKGVFKRVWEDHRHQT